MKVYILMASENGYNEFIVGVYGSEDKAEKIKTEKENNDANWHLDFSICPYDVE